MFGSLGVPELLLIFAVILIVFGPRRIPEIGRTLGKALGEFRKATDDFKSTIEREVRLEELKKVTWPDFPQLKNATLVIIVFVIIVALIIWIMDMSVRGIINMILGLFT